MNPISRLLNSFTMYRVVLYGLILMVVWAAVLSVVHQISYTPVSLLGSLAAIVAAGFAANYALSKAFASFPGTESWLITSLILFLILKPAMTVADYSVIVLVAALAMASKYVLALSAKHIFNPAAIALVIIGFLGSGQSFWWVGSAMFLPVVVVAGSAVVWKIRRFPMVWMFMAVALVVSGLSGHMLSQPLNLVQQTVLSGPLVFFATIMLIEPATMPPSKKLRYWYAAIVGLLYGLHFAYGPFYSSPEMALVLGNIFSFAVSHKRGYRLRLKAITPLGGGSYELAYIHSMPMSFRPGQYMEWTHPHAHPDSRGNRRYFTLASSPEETELKIAIRYDPEHSSSFKRSLMGMKAGEEMWAAGLTGNFTLPKDAGKKLVFIAGGIGITPFRSMVTHLLQKNETRDITLLYSAVTADGFAYREDFEKAKAMGVKTQYFITGKDIPAGWSGKTGLITAEAVKESVGEYVRAVYYLSGPNAMVENYKGMLIGLGVPKSNIRTDYFPGY